MNFPPWLMRLNISGRRRCSLWLPLFLLWPLAAALAIVLSPLFLLLLLILWFFGWGRLLLFSVWWFFGVLCALRGLEVDINRGNRVFLIAFK